MGSQQLGQPVPRPASAASISRHASRHLYSSTLCARAVRCVMCAASAPGQLFAANFHAHHINTMGAGASTQGSTAVFDQLMTKWDSLQAMPEYASDMKKPGACYLWGLGSCMVQKFCHSHTRAHPNLQRRPPPLAVTRRHGDEPQLRTNFVSSFGWRGAWRLRLMAPTKTS